MRDAWPGPATDVIVDDAALSTAENAAHVRAVALELGVEEVVVVTSSWHSARAAALFRRRRGPASAAPGRPRHRRAPRRHRRQSPGQLWRAGARRLACLVGRSRCSSAPRGPLGPSVAAAGSKRSFAASVGTRVG